MVQVGDSSPLSITKKAQTRLAFVKIDKKINKSTRLRVKSRANVEIGILGFDMFFDEKEANTDMVYKINGIELILDPATAYYLVGSVLDVDQKGEFLFKHLESLDQLEDLGAIQYN